ncbi:hypothetical protein [Nocardia sp. NPDC046763]|uniref:hypothetical protein n=1 Tax=Nocardia sp. NPDC046763 TaxID=3155256 RepID=UPI0033C1D919
MASASADIVLDNPAAQTAESNSLGNMPAPPREVPGSDPRLHMHDEGPGEPGDINWPGSYPDYPAYLDYPGWNHHRHHPPYPPYPPYPPFPQESGSASGSNM